MIHCLYSGRSVVPVDVRETVPIGVGFRSPVMQPQMMLHGEPFSLDENVRVVMPFQERYGGMGHHHRRDLGGFEAVALQRRPLPPPEIRDVVRYQPREVEEEEIIVLGKPPGATVSGSKRKARSVSTPTGSNGVSSDNSKKIIEEWRCALCDISATCERGLADHLAGKKHLAKVESSKGKNVVGDIGLGVTVSSVKKQKSAVKSSVQKKKSSKIKTVSEEVKMNSEGGNKKKMFKFWCKMCQTGAQDERVMSDHKKGKKHIKNLRQKARARRLSNRK